MLSYDAFLKLHPKIQLLDPNIPEDLQISTMTLVCKIPTFFNVLNIAKYVELDKQFILSVKWGNTNEVFRSLIAMKSKKDKMAVRKNFYNQSTMIIRTINTGRINIKLFRNGAIQLTGCKNISIPMWILYNLFSVLRKSKYIVENNEDKEIKYVTCAAFLHIESIFNLRIAMINSNFNIDFHINREKLFNLLTIDKYDCVYEPSRHAGVNLRYASTSSIDNGKPTSIFVFDKGAIIITGARNYRQLIECYKFINVYLLEHYNEIVRIDMPIPQ